MLKIYKNQKLHIIVGIEKQIVKTSELETIFSQSLYKLALLMVKSLANEQPFVLMLSKIERE